MQGGGVEVLFVPFGFNVDVVRELFDDQVIRLCGYLRNDVSRQGHGRRLRTRMVVGPDLSRGSMRFEDRSFMLQGRRRLFRLLGWRGRRGLRKHLAVRGDGGEVMRQQGLADGIDPRRRRREITLRAQRR